MEQHIIPPVRITLPLKSPAYSQAPGIGLGATGNVYTAAEPITQAEQAARPRLELQEAKRISF